MALMKQRQGLLKLVPHINRIHPAWLELNGGDDLGRLDEVMPRLYERFKGDGEVSEDELAAFYLLARNRQERERLRAIIMQPRYKLVEEAKARLSSFNPEGK